MRMLHQVRRHEKFVASGVYQYYENEAPAAVSEHWNIYQLPDSYQIVRIDRDARASQHRTSLLIEALRKPDGHYERCDLRLFFPLETAVVEAQASYNFGADRVEIGRKLPNGDYVDETLTLPAGTIIYLLGRVFTGDVIAQVAAGGKPAPVFLPNIVDVRAASLFSGLLEERTARQMGEEPLSIGRRTYQARRFQFLGSSYDEHSHFWLDEHNRLLKYETPTGWTVILSQHAP